jgi:hypothetical protein
MLEYFCLCICFWIWNLDLNSNYNGIWNKKKGRTQKIEKNKTHLGLNTFSGPSLRGPIRDDSARSGMTSGAARSAPPSPLRRS